MFRFSLLLIIVVFQVAFPLQGAEYPLWQLPLADRSLRWTFVVFRLCSGSFFCLSQLAMCNVYVLHYAWDTPICICPSYAGYLQHAPYASPMLIHPRSISCRDITDITVILHIRDDVTRREISRRWRQAVFYSTSRYLVCHNCICRKLGYICILIIAHLETYLV